MNKILILEDDENQADWLADILQTNYPHWEIVSTGTLSDAKEKIDISINNGFTLFLLDVRLSDEADNRDGFMLAGYIRSKPIYFKTPIIFLTSVAEDINYALTNFHCYNYIPKPFTENDILFQIEQMTITGFLEKKIIISDTNKVNHRLSQDSIIYIESVGHVKYLHTTKGELKTRAYNICEFNYILGKNFVQCHKRYIVNLDYISNIDYTNNLIGINEVVVPIGRNYKTQLRKCISEEY